MTNVINIYYFFEMEVINSFDGRWNVKTSLDKNIKRESYSKILIV